MILINLTVIKSECLLPTFSDKPSLIMNGFVRVWVDAKIVDDDVRAYVVKAYDCVTTQKPRRIGYSALAESCLRQCDYKVMARGRRLTKGAKYAPKLIRHSFEEIPRYLSNFTIMDNTMLVGDLRYPALCIVDPDNTYIYNHITQTLQYGLLADLHMEYNLLQATSDAVINGVALKGGLIV